MLEEDLDISSLVYFSGAHLLGDLLRSFLDTDNKSMTEGTLTGTLVVSRENNRFFASHAAAKDDDDTPGFEAAETM